MLVYRVIVSENNESYQQVFGKEMYVKFFKCDFKLSKILRKFVVILTFNSLR